ncbi:hypothetical protein ACFL6G_07930 [candidate division KSB1 bacterium]
MRKFILIIFICMMCWSSAFGQVEEYIGEFAFKPEIFITVGPSFPMRDVNFSENWNMGINIGAGVGFQLTEQLALAGSFDYNHFPFDDAHFSKLHPTELLVSGPVAKIMNFDLRLKFHFPSEDSKISPYITGGGGLFRMTSDELVWIDQIGQERATDPVNETVMCGLGGAGFEYQHSENICIFLEGLYNTGFTERNSTQIIQIKLGFKYKR